MVIVLVHEKFKLGKSLWSQELGQDRPRAIDFLQVQESDLETYQHKAGEGKKIASL